VKDKATGQDLLSLPQPPAASLRALLTQERWIEIVRILLTGLIALVYWLGLVPILVLWIAVAVGLYPLVRTGALDLIHEHKVGTEIFVTIATLVAVLGGETVAGAVLMVIILIAEFIAELNTDRARASIKALIGSVPQVALVRDASGERAISVGAVKIGDIVLVRAGEKIPVDGHVIGGEAAVNEAPITGESLPKDKTTGSPVFAGTVVDAGALDIQTEKVGGDTTFSRIVALVENAEAVQAPVQKLADKVAAWLIPVVGPDPTRDGVVRWRCVDLCGQIAERFEVELHERTVGKLLHRMGLSYMQPRPHNPKRDLAAQEAFKKTSPRL
jgi:Zn2+/Cd2+-exporting ATPase